MPKSLLEQLRDVALKIQIEPKDGIGQAATVDSVVSVLSNLNKAYQNFLAIELTKSLGLSSKISNAPMASTAIKANMKLRIVELNFGSFEAGLAPELISPDISIFSNEVKTFEKAAFSEFKYLLASDFREHKVISEVGKKYSDEERAKIFKPIFQSVDKSYKLNIMDSDNQVIRTVVRPSKEKMRFYVPRLAKKIDTEEPKRTVLAYVDIGLDNDNLTAANINKVHYVAEIPADTHPFVLNEMVYKNFAVEFHQQLVVQVRLEENIFFFSNDELDISAWGETRQEGEEAFRFSLFAVYQNFYFEENERLSSEAKALKAYLFRITKSVTDHEA